MVLAILFDSVGVGEWLVLLAVLLIVVGPKRLPKLTRDIGRHYAKFRRAADAFKRQLMDMDREFERAVDEATTVEEPTAVNEPMAVEEPEVNENGDSTDRPA